MKWETFYYFGLGILCFWFAIETVTKSIPEGRLESYVKGYETGVRESVIQRSS